MNWRTEGKTIGSSEINDSSERNNNFKTPKQSSYSVFSANTGVHVKFYES